MEGFEYCINCYGTGKHHYYESERNESYVKRCTCVHYSTICHHSENHKNCKLVKSNDDCIMCDGKGFITWIEKVFENGRR
jgi:hypothetical protein